MLIITLFYSLLIPFRAYRALLPHLRFSFVLSVGAQSWRQWHCFLYGYRCVIAPDTEQSWFTVTHTHKSRRARSEKTPESLKSRCRNHFPLFESMYFWCFPPRGTSIMFFLFVFQRERPTSSRAGVLCWQVGYDQFFHFIPDLSRDLKLLGFIVIIKWPLM